MVPLFQVVMCHCRRRHHSDYYSTNELVIYKNKNTKKEKKNPALKRATWPVLVVMC